MPVTNLLGEENEGGRRGLGFGVKDLGFRFNMNFD